MPLCPCAPTLVVYATARCAAFAGIIAGGHYDAQCWRPSHGVSREEDYRKGRFTTGSTGAKNERVTLQRSLNNSTWVNVPVLANTTNATGGYTLSTKETVKGTYRGHAGTYTPSNSASLRLTVGTLTPTDITSSTTTPKTNVVFTTTLRSGTTLHSSKSIIIIY